MGKLRRALGHNIAAFTKNCSVTDDLSPAFTIWHNGASVISGSTTTEVTAATITFDSGDDLTFTINGAADTRFGTGGKLDCSTETGTYDSFSELYDKINSVPGWCFRIEAGISTDLIDNTTRNVLVKSATDCFHKGVTFWWDTSAAEMHNIVISNRRIISSCSDESKYPKIACIENEGGAANALDYFKANFDIGGTTPVLTMTVYSCDDASSSDTLMGTQILPDGSAETYDFTAAGGLTALAGERLVVKLTCTAASGADIGTLTEFRAVGRSIGGRYTA